MHCFMSMSRARSWKSYQFIEAGANIAMQPIRRIFAYCACFCFLALDILVGAWGANNAI